MTIAETRLKIRYFRIDHRNPDPRQRRKYTRRQIQHLKGLNEALVFTVPSLAGPRGHQTELPRCVDRMIRRSRTLPGNAARHQSVLGFENPARGVEVTDAA